MDQDAMEKMFQPNADSVPVGASVEQTETQCCLRWKNTVKILSISI